MFKLALVVLSCLVLIAECQKPKRAEGTQTVKETPGNKPPEELPKNLRDALKRMEAIDIDTVMRNDRILTNYLKCFLNKGPCTSEAKSVKQFISLLVETQCNECDAKQRKIIKKSMMQVKTKKPKEYQELIKLYDPQGTRVVELEKFLAKSR